MSLFFMCPPLNCSTDYIIVFKIKKSDFRCESVFFRTRICVVRRPLWLKPVGRRLIINMKYEIKVGYYTKRNMNYKNALCKITTELIFIFNK